MGIRAAVKADWERVIEIYNQAIAAEFCTADTERVSVDSRKEWLLSHTDSSYPIYVEEYSGTIRGWCSLSPYREGRRALRFTVELSYYVATDFLRQGIGTALIEYAVGEAQKMGYRSLFGIVLDRNEASICLLGKLGFERWGHLPGVADFDGVECGHLYFGRRLD